MEVTMTQLKQEAPQLLSNLSEELIVTKRGKAIAKIVPLSQEKEITPGRLRHTVIEMGDIISPLEEDWDACI